MLAGVNRTIQNDLLYCIVLSLQVLTSTRLSNFQCRFSEAVFSHQIKTMDSVTGNIQL